MPDRVAVICGDEQLTYAQLEDKANRLAHHLIDQGVQKYDKVGLYRRNRIEIVIAMLNREGGRHLGERQLPLRGGRTSLPVRQLRHGRV